MSILIPVKDEEYIRVRDLFRDEIIKNTNVHNQIDVSEPYIFHVIDALSISEIPNIDTVFEELLTYIYKRSHTYDQKFMYWAVGFNATNPECLLANTTLKHLDLIEGLEFKKYSKRLDSLIKSDIPVKTYDENIMVYNTYRRLNDELYSHIDFNYNLARDFNQKHPQLKVQLEKRLTHLVISQEVALNAEDLDNVLAQIDLSKLDTRQESYLIANVFTNNTERFKSFTSADELSEFLNARCGKMSDWDKFIKYMNTAATLDMFLSDCESLRVLIFNAIIGSKEQLADVDLPTLDFNI